MAVLTCMKECISCWRVSELNFAIHLSSIISEALPLVLLHDFEALEIRVSLDHIYLELYAAVAVVFDRLGACVLNSLDYLGQAFFGELLRAVLELLGKLELLFEGNVPLDVALKVVFVIIIVFIVVFATLLGAGALNHSAIGAFFVIVLDIWRIVAIVSVRLSRVE